MAVAPGVIASAGHNALQRFAATIVDPHVGLVGWVREERPAPSDPAFVQFYARAANTAAFSRLANFRDAGGASLDRDRALAKAVGEAIERYCAAIYDPTTMPVVSAAEASFRHTAPREYALYGEAQYESAGFPWRRFATTTPVRWVAGRDLIDGKECYLPAVRVFVPYLFYEKDGEVPIDQPMSTGLACHESEALATRSAILEVVERDAFSIVWQASLSPPRIDRLSLPRSVAALLGRFEAVWCEIELFNLTLDHGIPTILATLKTRNDGRPPFAVAAAAGTTPTEAAVKALEELAHTARYCRFIADREGPLEASSAHTTVVDQQSHLRFWLDRERVASASFLWQSPRVQMLKEIASLEQASPEAEVELLAERIAAVGERVVVCDVTTDDVRRLDLHVVRAVIPGFHPLRMGYALRALGGVRLYDVPLRVFGVPFTDNPLPHPYP